MWIFQGEKKRQTVSCEKNQRQLVTYTHQKFDVNGSQALYIGKGDSFKLLQFGARRIVAIANAMEEILHL